MRTRWILVVVSTLLDENKILWPRPSILKFWNFIDTLVRSSDYRIRTYDRCTSIGEGIFTDFDDSKVRNLLAKINQIRTRRVRGVLHAGLPKIIGEIMGLFEVPHFFWDLLLFLQINRQILRLIFFGLEKDLAVVGGLRFFQSPPFCIFAMQNILHSMHGNRNRLFLHLEWFCCMFRSLPPEMQITSVPPERTPVPLKTVQPI